MERKARFILTTKRTSMNETEFEAVQALLEHSLVCDDGFEDTIENELKRLFSDIDGDDDTSELITDGVVIKKPGGSIVLQYNESELTGMEGAVTRIVFGARKPDFVVMMRDGYVNTSLSFETGKRHTSKYNTPYMPFDLCVNTIRVTNNFEDNGEIEIEYIIEIRGLSTEWTTLKIKADILD